VVDESQPGVSAGAETPNGDESQSVEEAAAPAVDADRAEPAGAPAAKRKKKRLPRALRPQRTRKRRQQPAERKPIARLPKPEQPRGRRQERQGVVVSAAADKTIVVRVDTVKLHPAYKKVIRRSTKLHAHDEANRAKVGDVVRVVETRPLSKLKRWRLQAIVEEAK
jgi:small subunit ribosomal protein S17